MKIFCAIVPPIILNNVEESFARNLFGCATFHEAVAISILTCLSIIFSTKIIEDILYLRTKWERLCNHRNPQQIFYEIRMQRWKTFKANYWSKRNWEHRIKNRLLVKTEDFDSIIWTMISMIKLFLKTDFTWQFLHSKDNMHNTELLR